MLVTHERYDEKEVKDWEVVHKLEGPGKNVTEITKEFKMSRTTIYKLLTFAMNIWFDTYPIIFCMKRPLLLYHFLRKTVLFNIVYPQVL